MNILDEVVTKLKGGFDKLSAEERQYYFAHLKQMEGKPVDLNSFRTFIIGLKDGIGRELVEAKEGTDKSLMLKARLKNIFVLEQFLYGPERAKKAIERYYHGLSEKLDAKQV